MKKDYKNNRKYLAKRGLAMFISLTVCMNMLLLNTFAADFDGTENFTESSYAENDDSGHTENGYEGNDDCSDVEGNEDSDTEADGNGSDDEGAEDTENSGGSESGTEGAQNPGSSDNSGNESDAEDTEGSSGSESGAEDTDDGGSNESDDKNAGDADGGESSGSENGGEGSDESDSSADGGDSADKTDTEGENADNKGDSDVTAGDETEDNSEADDNTDQSDSAGGAEDPDKNDSIDGAGDIKETEGADKTEVPDKDGSTAGGTVSGAGNVPPVKAEVIDKVPKAEIDEEKILSAIKAVIKKYRDGFYETDEELSEAVDEITAMMDELEEDYLYSDEFLETMEELQELLDLGVKTLETEGECTCEYMCVWFGGKYININEDCPVCNHATEEELDPYTYDPAHPENFVCKGEQPVIPGDKPDCTHNGSLWESWAPGGGSPDLIPAGCQWPATSAEAIECWGCGARWLWKFQEDSERDPDNHYFGRNEPEIVKEATCMEDGLQVQTCLVCGDIETVIKGGHMMPEDESQITRVEATCQDGKIQYACDRCGEEVTEIIPGHHTFPEGENIPFEKQGICTECGAVSYRVYTYEKGATPSGSGYEILICARVIEEPDGSIYGTDSNGNRLEEDSFPVIINESLMGKVKPRKDDDGNTVMTQVAGYRNMDDPEGTIYKVGDMISFEDVPDMFVNVWDSNGVYFSGNDYRAVYLEAVREDVLGEDSKFVTHKVEYEAAFPGTRSDISDTSEGVTAKKIFENGGRTCRIIYTIPEGYEGDTVSINATKDVMDAYRAIQDNRFGYQGSQPGDTLGPVFIELVNNSEKTFAYEKGSFVLQSPGHEGEPAYVGDINTFDGTVPPERSVPSRVSNGALRYLYGQESDLGNADLQDEVLGAKLVEKGYENGVADLHQYYLDYYNNFFSSQYGTTWKSLNEIPYIGLVLRDPGIYGGQSSTAGVKETNPEVAGAGYSYMYTRLFCAIKGNQENLKDEAGEYAVGRYMAGEVSCDDEAGIVWGKLTSDSGAKALTGISLYLNGESNNFFQQTAWGIEVGFRLKETDEPDKPEEPEKPEEPDKPEEPEKPETPSRPAGDDDDDDDDEEPERPRTDIPDDEVPLTEVPLTDIPDQEVPLTDIVDEEIPLQGLPKTGDRSRGDLWMLLCMISVSSVAALLSFRKREEK